MVMPFQVVNIVLAFYIGNDLGSVTGNTIGQPMATVRKVTIVIKGLNEVVCARFSSTVWARREHWLFGPS
jgi:hypothetical protein